jgi:hypothetical protein
MLTSTTPAHRARSMRRRGSGREGRTRLEAVSEGRRAAAAFGEAPAGRPSERGARDCSLRGGGPVSTCAPAHRPERALSPHRLGGDDCIHGGAAVTRTRYTPLSASPNRFSSAPEPCAAVSGACMPSRNARWPCRRFDACPLHRSRSERALLSSAMNRSESVTSQSSRRITLIEKSWTFRLRLAQQSSSTTTR